MGQFMTGHPPNTNSYMATLEFKFSQPELCALQQAGDYLEIDFAIYGFTVPAEWEGYTIDSTNLPGGIHDVAYRDKANFPRPAVTRIYTKLMNSETTYYATLNWTAPLQAGATPQIQFEFTPSHWSRATNLEESASCLHAFRNNKFGWCVFPNDKQDAVLFGPGAFLNGVADGKFNIDTPRWFSWSPTTTSGKQAVLQEQFAVSTPRPGNKLPIASYSYSRLTGAGNRVNLDGRASRDPDGSINKWQWMRDGQVIATGSTATVSLGATDVVDIVLIVTDNGGATGSINHTIKTPNRAPVIANTSPGPGNIVGSNTPTLSVAASDDDGDALQYSFRVTGSIVDVSSGWIGPATWKVPASKLDPGTNYSWTVQVRDPKSLTVTRTSNFTVAMLPTANELVSLSTGNGYWEVAGDGGVFSYGAAQFYGSVPGLNIRVNNIIGMARTPTDRGYWVVGKDGGVFAFGDAQFYGSLPGLKIAVTNIVGMAPTGDGKGYWLVGADGGVFAFGDAGFYGSMGGKPLNKPVQAIAPTASSHGYWLAAGDGGVFAFGDAPFFGSMGGKPLNYPVVDIDSTPDGKGYWLAAQDGGVFAFGNAGFFGSMGGKPLNGHINSMSTTPDGGGYWLNGCDGGIFSFGNAPFYGSQPRYACRGISY